MCPVIIKSKFHYGTKSKARSCKFNVKCSGCVILYVAFLLALFMQLDCWFFPFFSHYDYLEHHAMHGGVVATCGYTISYMTPYFSFFIVSSSLPPIPSPYCDVAMTSPSLPFPSSLPFPAPFPLLQIHRSKRKLNPRLSPYNY